MGNDDNVAAVVLTAKAGNGVPPASLSPNPNNLFELWDESTLELEEEERHQLSCLVSQV